MLRKSLLLLAPLFLFAESDRLFRDLEIVRQVDSDLSKKIPLLYTDFGMAGYFAMPSARMRLSGDFGLGGSYAPPYNIYFLSAQLFNHLEAVGSYWIYRGIIEKNFGHQGYGDDAERSANLKVSLLRPEDGFPYLPNFSLGWIDFLGSCRFNSFFAAATEELPDYNLEATLGWGRGRINGFFGGLAWSPFRNLTFAAEYDANNYKKHPHEHPSGRSVKSRVNAGVQLHFLNLFHASAHTLRGETWAASLSLNYDLGSSPGLFPKIYDPAPDVKPLDRVQTAEESSQTLARVFKEQSFDLYSAYLIPQPGGLDALWLKILNVRYREEEAVRLRLERVLSTVLPDTISSVTAVVEADGVPVYEYRFRAVDLQRYREGLLGEAEFQIISPRRDASSAPSSYESVKTYQRSRPTFVATFRPRLLTYFGSSSGKFKAQTGFSLTAEGYLFDQIYYLAQGSFTAFSQIQNIQSWDVLNPSRIINVRTDALLYHQARSFHLDSGYFQRSWHLGQGWFSRLSGGYFETAYGGVAGEVLYYPASCNWAIGFEAAALWKRAYDGLGFTNKIRKLTPYGLTHVPYTGFQYFIDFYYDYKPLRLDFKASVGQFLARDKGVRFEGGRTFDNGIRVGLWYTLTNANDVVNHKRYYDKGISITIPLDLFMNQSSRTRIGTALAAWLRDCGAKAYTGKELYHTLFWERYNSHPVFY